MLKDAQTIVFFGTSRQCVALVRLLNTDACFSLVLVFSTSLEGQEVLLLASANGASVEEGRCALCQLRASPEALPVLPPPLCTHHRAYPCIALVAQRHNTQWPVEQLPPLSCSMACRGVRLLGVQHAEPCMSKFLHLQANSSEGNYTSEDPSNTKG